MKKGDFTKKEFYRLNEILKHGAQYNLIYGERSNGKSYAVKEFCLKDFRDNGNEFVVIRRLKSDITKSLSDLYFSDCPVEQIFKKSEQNVIYTQSGKVFIAEQDDEKRENITQCGYVRALSEAQRYSSGAYNNVKNIVFEEFIALDGKYLPNEIMLFRHIISTIARKRDVRVFLIGNTISRLSPYWREFGISNIAKQAQGTIDDYQIVSENGVVVKIACEYCANSATKSKMFFGADSKMTNEGKWLTRECPTPTIEMFEQSEKQFEFVLEWNSTRFLCTVLCGRGGEQWLYVTPKTTAVQPYTQVYTNCVTANPYYSRGLFPRTLREKKILALIETRTFFSDNLTGTEFSETLRKLKTLT